MKRFYDYDQFSNVSKKYQYKGLPFCDGYLTILKSERLLPADTKNTITKQYEQKYKLPMGEVCIGNSIQDKL